MTRALSTSRRWSHGSPPRVRGHRLRQGSDRPLYGSPPRVRGHRFSQPQWEVNVRFTPACAGTSQPISPLGLAVRPRVCGDNRWPPSAGRRVHPRVCGERLLRDGDSWEAGVHPRVCGETCSEVVGAPVRDPPRVRGRGRYASVAVVFSGSPPRVRGGALPLHVGTLPRVHPRVCGEGLSCSIRGRGSPPRVRGHRPRLPALGGGFTPACAGRGEENADCSVARGFTPACAGRGSTAPRAPRWMWVHPRVCGEGQKVRRGRVQDRVHPRVCGEGDCVIRGDRSGVGSPPRVRGGADVDGVFQLYGGFTPACAGRGAHGSPVRSSRRVHPRVCGEGRSSCFMTLPRPGSPPRVRGGDRHW